MACTTTCSLPQPVRAELVETAAQFMNLMPDALTISLDEEIGEGVVLSPAVPDRRMTIKEIARRCWIESRKTIAAAVSHRPISCPPAYVTTFAEVEVNTWTGQVSTHRVALMKIASLRLSYQVSFRLAASFNYRRCQEGASDNDRFQG